MPKSRAAVTKRQYEALANFRYRMRQFLRYSEQITRKHGLTPLQYQLLLQVKGYPGRDWATVSELAERYEEINLLYTISEILGRTVSLEEASADILREVSETVGARRATVAARCCWPT